MQFSESNFIWVWELKCYSINRKCLEIQSTCNCSNAILPTHIVGMEFCVYVQFKWIFNCTLYWIILKLIKLVLFGKGWDFYGEMVCEEYLNLSWGLNFLNKGVYRNNFERYKASKQSDLENLLLSRFSIRLERY